MKKLFFLAPLAVAAMALPSCKNNDPITLKMNLTPGSQYLQTVVMKTNIKQMGMDISNTMNMEYTYAVAAGDGTDRKINVTYDRIGMDMKTPVGGMSYDSRKDGDNASNPLSVMGKMTGKTFTMVVTETGEVKSVTGMDAILNNMVDPSNPNSQTMHDQLAKQFNDTTIRTSMQQALNVYPDKPVHPGDKWNKTMSLNMGTMSGVQGKTEYTLKDITNNVAHIDISCTINGNATMPQGSVGIDGKQTGTMSMDVPTGLITEMKMKQDVQMKIPGQTAPMPMTNEITYTAKKK